MSEYRYICLANKTTAGLGSSAVSTLIHMMNKLFGLRAVFIKSNESF